jgi:hypothetical protein
LGCWISQCYGPFSLGARFETYEPFIALIFKFFSGRGKPRITESVDTEARLYFQYKVFYHEASQVTKQI